MGDMTPRDSVVQRLIDIYYKRYHRYRRYGMKTASEYWHGKFEALEMIYERCGFVR
jgi:hypothetical protein